MATVQFRGMQPDEFIKLQRAKVAKKVQACGILIKNEMKVGLSSRDNLKGSHDSAESAGGNPFKITGRLAGSITNVFDEETMTSKVGTPVPYGAYLQRGTRKMAARPWVTIAFNNCIEQIKKIFGANGGGEVAASNSGPSTKTGRRGGVFHLNSSGNKVYHKRGT